MIKEPHSPKKIVVQDLTDLTLAAAAIGQSSLGSNGLWMCVYKKNIYHTFIFMCAFINYFKSSMCNSNTDIKLWVKRNWIYNM